MASESMFQEPPLFSSFGHDNENRDDSQNVHFPFNNLTQQLAQVSFMEFRCCESCRLCTLNGAQGAHGSAVG